MESPFLFGRVVSKNTFTNRVDDITRLSNNLTNHINTILISPRRWGKTSLVNKVATSLNNRAIKVIQLDLMGIRNEEEFYSALARATIKATSNKLADWLQLVKDVFKHISPKISMGNDPLNDFEISFEWKDIEKNYREILQLPEKIAAKKNIKLVICIDEFQNIESFKDPLLFQKKLRTEWQHQQSVTYCLYGSKQHMMTSLFEKQSMPFYKFGDVIYLSKIERKDWVKYIQKQFLASKKTITAELANTIAAVVEDHSYYVQQLCYLIWLQTQRKVTKDLIEESIDNLLVQNTILYNRDTEELTSAQLNFLKALANGIETGLSSKEIIHTYQLGTSANVLKIKKALQQKELIEVNTKGIYFMDPVYRLWFIKNILRKNILSFLNGKNSSA